MTVLDHPGGACRPAAPTRQDVVDRRLTGIDDGMGRLFGFVIGDLPRAVSAAVAGDVAVARAIAARRPLVTDLSVELATDAGRLVALHAPAGRALRRALVARRLALDLGQAHDLVASVAGRGAGLPRRALPPVLAGTLARMGTLAGSVWLDAGEAYRRRDGRCLPALERSVVEVDGLHRDGLAILPPLVADRDLAAEVVLVLRFVQRLAAGALDAARSAEHLTATPSVSR